MELKAFNTKTPSGVILFIEFRDMLYRPEIPTELEAFNTKTHRGILLIEF